MTRYVIRGGKEGKERLKLLAQVMLPTTSWLLNTVGLKHAMHCLDVGCGGGDVTLLMARRVGHLGKVAGIDFDRDILRLAQQEADAAQLHNVEFRLADATEFEEEAIYDLVYARFLLTHLGEPQKCLNRMISATKAGGLIVVEDIDFSASFCYPSCAAYERYTELYQRVVKRTGGDPNIGPKLPGMLLEAGIEKVQVNVVQPTHIDGEGKFMSPITMEKISSAVIAEGLATQEEVTKIIDELNDCAADSHTVMSLPRVVQTWGIRT